MTTTTSASDLQKTLRRIKACIRNRSPVIIDAVPGLYVPIRLSIIGDRLRGLTYSVECMDMKQKKSTVTVGLNGSDWHGLTPKEVSKIEKNESGRSASN